MQEYSWPDEDCPDCGRSHQGGPLGFLSCPLISSLVETCPHRSVRIIPNGAICDACGGRT